MNLSFLNPVCQCCSCCLPIQRYRRFRWVAPTGRSAPVCVNATRPSHPSQRDHAVQMEGGLIKLTWMSVEWKRLRILLHMWWAPLEKRRPAGRREQEQAHETLPFPIHPAHASHSHVRLHWSEGWDGGHTHTHHSNFISWYMNTTTRSRSMCWEALANKTSLLWGLS